MQGEARLKLFRRIATFAAVLALVVVVLGAWVRLSAAGLGCPDWPGCYGHLSAAQAAAHADTLQESFPGRSFEYAKAHKEMLHRYVAGALVLLIISLAILAFINRRTMGQPLVLPFVLVGIVFLQALLGMWTVTLLLKPLIVVLHLAGGLTTLALLTWLATTRKDAADISGAQAHSRGLRIAGGIALAVLIAQILLGGWTSSNYAALACPDFPTCQNSFWPAMDTKEAFVLWRGLGIDYEGGVLDHPARVAIHFMHRLGAMVTALTLLIVGIYAWRAASHGRARMAGALVVLALLTQVVIGPLMVVRGMPLALAIAHNGVAALLLVAVVRLNALTRSSA